MIPSVWAPTPCLLKSLFLLWAKNPKEYWCTAETPIKVYLAGEG